ncbi:lysozyme inhibitor LprI family protein [Pseudomonas sp. MF4836]|uniref:lysozyme inhibitor LprI family protein n=1 Tax=Pseudomonas sp. MF4836 TaxID=1960827 RepID=UPI00129015A3|nr:hypothetical protein [Pseudomonas sp. MF4836]
MTSKRHHLRDPFIELKSAIKIFYISFLPLLFPSTAVAELFATDLLGTWEVSQVHTNLESGRKSYYHWDSPLLRWRIFTLSEKEITAAELNTTTTCNNPSTTQKRVYLDDYLKSNLGGYGEKSRNSPIDDYKLNLPKNYQADIIIVKCENQIWNELLGASYLPSKKEDSDGSWLLLLNKKYMILRWHDETLLRLSKIPPPSKPSPSFSCEKSKHITEITICKSFELSGLDKSIASAFDLLLNETLRESIDVLEMRQQQKAWLRQRNACGENQSCLAKVMTMRLEQLSVFD